MKRCLKWLLPALILAEVALVRLDLLSLSSAILVVVVVEVLLLLVGGHQTLAAIRRYRRNRASGFDGWASLESGLTVLLPGPIARIVVTEPRLFYYLAKWMLRKTSLREGEYSYHRRSTLDMFVLMVVLVTPVEILVVELLLQAFLPLLWLRLLLLFLALYATAWLLGFYASRVALPHRLEEEGLRLRHGILAEGFIPYSSIEQVARKRRKAPEGGDKLRITGNEAHLAIGGHTDVTLKLNTPRTLQGFLRPTGPVSRIHLAADDPQQLARELEARIKAARSRRQPLPTGA